MFRGIFLGSLIVFPLCVGLSLVSDRGIFGIHEEPGRIIFYAGSGLLAGLSGIAAAVSGIVLGVSRFADLDDGHRRFLWTIALIMLIAVLIAVVLRLYPA